MLCLKCHNETRVIDSREDTEHSIRRRRECLKCAHRFTTFERAEMPRLIVVKRDGSKTPFQKEKIAQGIAKAAEKRPLSLADIHRIVETIEQQLYDRGDDEVSSRVIGELVMQELRTVDTVSYLRFASVYKAFRSANAFEKELKALQR